MPRSEAAHPAARMRLWNSKSSIAPAVVKRSAISVNVPMSANPNFNSSSEVLLATITAASSASLPRRESLVFIPSPLDSSLLRDIL